MKTLAIRLDDEQHAQLTVLAQLEEITVTDFIRTAIDSQLQAKRSQPELAAKAEAVLADINAEAEARRSALTGLFATNDGGEGADGTTEPKAPAGRRRKPAGES